MPGIIEVNLKDELDDSALAHLNEATFRVRVSTSRRRGANASEAGPNIEAAVPRQDNSDVDEADQAMAASPVENDAARQPTPTVEADVDETFEKPAVRNAARGQEVASAAHVSFGFEVPGVRIQLDPRDWKQVECGAPLTSQRLPHTIDVVALRDICKLRFGRFFNAMGVIMKVDDPEQNGGQSWRVSVVDDVKNMERTWNWSIFYLILLRTSASEKVPISLSALCENSIVMVLNAKFFFSHLIVSEKGPVFVLRDECRKSAFKVL